MSLLSMAKNVLQPIHIIEKEKKKKHDAFYVSYIQHGNKPRIYVGRNDPQNESILVSLNGIQLLPTRN